MKQNKIYFISKNPDKLREAEEILSPSKIQLIPKNIAIDELQTTDTSKLVKDKALKAFNIIRKPLFVEHTGLYINELNGFPGGLTELFWNSLGADRFTELFRRASDRRIIAKTIIGYIDGKKFYNFEGICEGSIAEHPKSDPNSDKDFQWDCIFKPKGYRRTYAELGSLKNKISMRRKALDEFVKFINKHNKK